MLHGHGPDKRCAHDAAVLGGRGQQEGNPLVGAALVLAGDVQHDVVPAVAPVGRKTGGEALGPLGENVEPHVGAFADDSPGLVAPRVCFGHQEVRRHADADELAGADAVRPRARALHRIVKVLGANDARPVDAAALVVVIHVAVVAALAHARAAVPGIPDVVHGRLRSRAWAGIASYMVAVRADGPPACAR